jgi:hypothetical protein
MFKKTLTGENQNTHCMLNNVLFENGAAVYEITFKTIAQTGRQQITIWRMRIACRIPKATNTHSENVIFVFLCKSRCTKAPYS